MMKFGMMKKSNLVWWKKGTGFLILPSHHRLQDYKNYIKPKGGFNPNTMHESRQDINYDSVGKPKCFVDVFEFRAFSFSRNQIHYLLFFNGFLNVFWFSNFWQLVQILVLQIYEHEDDL